jgi:hypothetical protein
MFWIFALFLVAGMIILSSIYEVFQSMKESQYEAIRVIYWAIVTGVFIWMLIAMFKLLF